MGRACMAYHRGSTLFFVPLAILPRGGHLEVEPVQVCQDSANPLLIWQTMEAALDESGKIVSLPDPRDSRSPVLSHCPGVQSWKQFVRGTACCDVERLSDSIVLTPLTPARGGGFSYQPDKAVTIDIGSPEAVIHALLGVFSAAF